MREILETRKNSDCITSTEVPVLFGVEKYKTLYQLVYEKQNSTEESFDSFRMKAGRELEPIIAKLASEELGVESAPFKKFIKDTNLKIGSSFDYLIKGDHNALLECKNVDSLIFNRDWWEDGEAGLMAPDHIEIQCQHQMLVSKMNSLYIAALVGGNELKIVKRKFSPEFGEQIKEKVKKFWEVDFKTPLEDLPITPQNAEIVFSKEGNTSSKKIFNDSDCQFLEYVERHKDLSEKKKMLDLEIKKNRAVMSRLAGDHQKIVGPNYSVSFYEVKEAIIPESIRKGFKSMRVNFREKK